MGEGTDFLYPFLGDEGRGAPSGALLEDLAASAVAKGEASAQLRAAALNATAGTRAAAAAAMAGRFAAGGRLLTFGNGGSSTDAAGLATLFTRPPWGSALPARTLVEDPAVLTALGNDVGFDLVFARQVIDHGTPTDIALGISTSGTSRNVLVAFEQASSQGLLTIGLAGYDGGAMALSPHVDHCLVVAADSIHRIQEAQATLGFALWAAVQEHGSTVDHG